MDFASEMLKKSAGGVHGLYAENMRRAVRLGREVLAEIQNPTEPPREPSAMARHYVGLTLPAGSLVEIDGMPFRLSEKATVHAAWCDLKVEAEPWPAAASVDAPTKEESQ